MSEHIEVKPKPLPTWQETTAKLMDMLESELATLDAMYDAMKAERDAARAELKKEEEGK